MKNIAIFFLTATLLMGCSAFRIHQATVTQGNIITDREIRQLHLGMTEEQVKNILGTPLLVNLFTQDHVVYIYTYESGGNPRTTQRVVCDFRKGRLASITH